KASICSSIGADKLQALLTKDARFVELNYLLGMNAIGQRKLNDAEKFLELAYAWNPRWPALTVSLANIAMTGEDFERALDFYQQTLVLEPRAIDAHIGKARALTYLARHEQAIAVVDEILTGQLYLGDAHYWRALNLFQLN